MDIPFKPPVFQATSFNCPSCLAFSKQKWHELSYHGNGGRQYVGELQIAICEHCLAYSVWINEKLIYPKTSTVPVPNGDLDKDEKADYVEAANILKDSPRGSAAVVRLLIQKLVKRILADRTTKDLNDNIGILVKDGLPIEIQQSLDVLRVIGNNAVHPGELDMRDNVETATALFGLVNLIADSTITRKRLIGQLYASLPTGAVEAIKKRDAAKSNEVKTTSE